MPHPIIKDEDYLKAIAQAGRQPGFFSFYRASFDKGQKLSRWFLFVLFEINALLFVITLVLGSLWALLFLLPVAKLLLDDITAMRKSHAYQCALAPLGVTGFLERSKYTSFDAGRKELQEKKILSPTETTTPFQRFEGAHQGHRFHGYSYSPVNFIKPAKSIGDSFKLRPEYKDLRCIAGFFKTGRPHHAHTVITTQEPVIFNWIQSKIIGLKRANMVDPEFEKKFEAYTDDQTEARFLFDHLKIAQLVDLIGDDMIEEIVVSAHDGDAAVMIAFSPDFFLRRGSGDTAEKLIVKDRMEALLAIYDALKLASPAD